MNRNNIKTGLYGIVLCFFAVLSCSEMDDYKEYVRDGEISYTGKIDSLKIYSGRNRVRVEGLFKADPKITECRIYWNDRADSLVIPVTKTANLDTLRTLIEGLDENIYNFEIRTYDQLGNSSVPVYATGTAYGQRYQASLINRPVNKSDLYAGDLTATVAYAGMDLTSGVFATEIIFMDGNDGEHILRVPIDSTGVEIENYKIGTEYQYRTLFLPDSTSIDTFYTDYTSIDPNIVYLKNYEAPFERESFSGRWGILANWITNDAAKSHNGYGGTDTNTGTAYFNLESGWGTPEIVNGKVYQTVTLSPGTYTFKANLRQSGGANDTWNVGQGDQAYLVVSEGDDLPDVDVIETSSATLGHVRVLRDNDPDGFKVEFTITEEKQVSVGYATTQPGGNVNEQYPGTANGRHCNIRSFEFYKMD
ncbi:DUF4998 domain-containing protein [Sinomicrobium sp. M5D2P9]